MERTDSMIPNDRLIRVLAADLSAVRRTASPLLLLLVWLVLVAAIAIVLAEIYDLEPLLRRFSNSIDLCATAVGSMLTAVLAGIAAFELSLPDRKPGWALVPVPAAIFWIGASTIGCLRPSADGIPVTLGGTDNCLLFILVAATPLSIFFIFLLRSSYTLHQNLTSIICGLACAAAAATLLNFIHAHDATAPDMAVHAFAVCAVILANRLFGSWFLTEKKFGVWRNTGHGSFELENGTIPKQNFRAPRDWTEHVEDNVASDRPAHPKANRADHKGRVIRFHRHSCDGSGRDQSSDS
jgi:hypothetical protein